MRIVDCIKRNGPTILSITAMFGVIGTAIASGWAVKKSEENKHHHLTYEDYWADDEVYATPVVKHDELTVKEYVKRNWKYYMPAVGCAIVTCGCIGLSDHLNRKRQSALISACIASTAMYNEYRKAIEEKYGEEVEKEICGSVMEKKAKEDDIYIPTATDDDVYLFYDELSGEYFNASMEKVVMMDGLECYILGARDWLG